jgi:hypothetical protein
MTANTIVAMSTKLNRIMNVRGRLLNGFTFTILLLVVTIQGTHKRYPYYTRMNVPAERSSSIVGVPLAGTLALQYTNIIRWQRTTHVESHQQLLLVFYDSCANSTRHSERAGAHP